MKRITSLLLCTAMLALTACGQTQPPVQQEQPEPTPAPEQEAMVPVLDDATVIELSDEKITVRQGENAVSTDLPRKADDPLVNFNDAVTVGENIIYYEDGHDFTYGEGGVDDAHSSEEAAAHTVVTITKPGTYVLTGELSAGQVAVDLGDGAKDDPEAVVTLVLYEVDITCTVAPAVIFYNVYECGDKENPTKDVDTSAAGANVYIIGNTENTINGSYVARIYKPDSVVLSADGTEVEEAKKLHKYDAAFYSKMSMNVDGAAGGFLNINAENEGLDSEMHLTVNGGCICIESGNDGINTNEDGVSVTTINGGELTVTVTGETGEGDGIDSNGWLVMNGGTVIAEACDNSADSGIDSDMGIHIGEGATVIATGHMLDRIESCGQNYAVFNLPSETEATFSLKNSDGTVIMEQEIGNAFSVLIFSSPNLTEGDYTLWSGEKQLGHSGVQGSEMMGGHGGGRPGGMQPPEGFEPDNMPEPPEGFDPNGQPPQWNGGFEHGKGERPEMPEWMEPPEGFEPGNMPFRPGEMPEGFDPAQVPQGGFGGGRGDMPGGGQPATEKTFTIAAGANYFSGVGELVQ